MRLPAPRPREPFCETAASSAPLWPGNETEFLGVLAWFGSASLLMERSQSSVSEEVRDNCDIEKSTCSEDMQIAHETSGRLIWRHQADGQAESWIESCRQSSRARSGGCRVVQRPEAVCECCE